jgi:membrane protease YdiL (CAAX protease family)
VAASWTLAAVGEEVAYRGYLLTRLRQLLPAGIAGSVAAVTVASLLFGLAHAEQGLVGVAVTTLDAAYFAVLRYRFATLWASVLAHGLNNTIGLVGFYLVGPVYGLW